MDSQKILNADYLDIVFDNRNKAYGGYLLRKEYEYRTRKALTFAVLSATLLMGYFSWLTHKSPAAILNIATTRVAELTDIKIHELQKQIIPPPPPPTHPKIQANTVVANATLVIKPDNDVHIVDHPAITTIVVDPHTDPSSPNGDIHSTNTIPSTSSTNTNTAGNIKDWVEVMPSFKGDMYKYLGEHLRFPEEAKRAGANGKVYVRFIINEDGSVTDAKMLRGDGSYGFEDEAIRVISSMPKWNPGRQNNVPVKVYYTIPIVFVLQ